MTAIVSANSLIHVITSYVIGLHNWHFLQSYSVITLGILPPFFGPNVISGGPTHGLSIRHFRWSDTRVVDTSFQTVRHTGCRYVISDGPTHGLSIRHFRWSDTRVVDTSFQMVRHTGCRYVISGGPTHGLSIRQLKRCSKKMLKQIAKLVT